MNIENTQLLNLFSRYNSHGQALTPNQVLAWDATDARYEPVSLSTIGGLSVTTGSDIQTGAPSAFFIVDLADTAGYNSATIDGEPTAGKTVLITSAGAYSVSSGGVWSVAAPLAELTNRYAYVSSGVSNKGKFYYSSNGSSWTEFTFQNTLTDAVNIQTINGQSLLGSGNIVVSAGTYAAQGSILSVRLGEALSAGTAVYFKTSETLPSVGSSTYAGSTTTFSGILLTTGVIGDTVQVATKGAVLIYTGFTPGSTYYVQGNGSFSTTSTSQVLGRAMSSKHILITF